MKEKFLKYVFLKYKQRFYDYFMDDLLRDIPKNDLVEPAIAILARDRETISKLLYYQAHTIHRRNPTDFVNMERKLGMLTQIKLLLVLIGRAHRGEEYHPVVGKTVAPPEDWDAPIDAFKKRQVFKKETKK